MYCRELSRKLHGIKSAVLFKVRDALMHLSIETPTPTPGLCEAMWGIFMVFDLMVSPWGWGISQDLLSIFIWQSGNEVGI